MVTTVGGIMLVRRCVVLWLLIGSLAACAGEPEGAQRSVAPSPEQSASIASPDSGSIPTNEQLAEALLTPEDLGDGWQLEPDPPGVPGIALCPAAEPLRDTGLLPWQAFTVMNAGSADSPAVASYLQLLMAGEPAQMRATYDSLTTAISACDGVVWQGDDGATRQTESMQVPTVGDARTGQRVYSDGPDGVTEFRYVVVLDDSVLMLIDILELRESSEDVIVSQQELDALVTEATERLTR